MPATDIPLTPRQREFAEKHHNLIYSFLRRYHLSVDEWYGVAALGFCRAVVRFDPSRKKAFSSFAYCVMLNDVRQVMRKERNTPMVISLQDEIIGGFPIEDVLGYEQDFTTVGTARLLRQFTASIAVPVHRKMFTLSLEGKKQQEIADEIGFSQSHVSRILGKVKSDFRDYYEKHS